MTTPGGDGTMDYLLRNENEMDRLEAQHPLMKDVLGGTLVLPPIDLSGTGRRILDSGTANGLWLRDLQSTLGPSHTYIGTDINPTVFPPSPPSNTTYAVQDINVAWPASWAGSFDLVHQRLVLAAAGKNMPNVIASLCALVKPGGWIQLLEMEQVLGENDGPAVHQFIKLMTDIFVFSGAERKYAREMKVWVEGAGFVDVQSRLFDCYLGAKNKDGKLARQSAVSTSTAAAGLSAWVDSMPPGTTTVTPEERETLAERLKAELLEQGAYCPMRVVWGRKPAA